MALTSRQLQNAMGYFTGGLGVVKGAIQENKARSAFDEYRNDQAVAEVLKRIPEEEQEAFLKSYAAMAQQFPDLGENDILKKTVRAPYYNLVNKKPTKIGAVNTESPGSADKTTGISAIYKKSAPTEKSVGFIGPKQGKEAQQRDTLRRAQNNIMMDIPEFGTAETKVPDYLKNAQDIFG